MIDLKKIPVIQVSTIGFPEATPFWLDRPFQTVQERFPQWLAAEILLETYIDDLGDFTIAMDGYNCAVGPVQPTVMDVYGERVPAYMTFPPEDRPLFLEILAKCVQDFLPNLDPMLGQPICQANLYAIESMVKTYHRAIENMGGPGFKDWLRYNLGLYSNWNGINFMRLEIGVRD